jgi:type VI secretion system protein VasD
MNMPSRRRRLLVLLCAAASAALAGCAGPKPPPPPPLPSPRPPPAPPPPPPTALKATLIARDSVNPDLRGRPSPVTVRVYLLKSRTAFEGADFFALYDKDKETLAADLLEREEFLLKPGDTRLIEKPLASGNVHVAVFAAFRDIERAQWRAVMTIIPRQLNTLEISLEQSMVTIVRRN